MIVVEMFGLNGMCKTEQARNDLTDRLVKRLQQGGVEDSDDIRFSFSENHNVDGRGQPASFCIIHVGPNSSTKDLVLVGRVIKSECIFGNKIQFSILHPLPS
ncbi:MAG: hypothetical protein WC827_04135 [Candidatus Paceibacterota bacterium]